MPAWSRRSRGTACRPRRAPTSLTASATPCSSGGSLGGAGGAPAEPWNRLPAPARSDLDHRLRRYLVEGGFPEAQGIEACDRSALLRSYVDVVVLRDVIERYA